MSFLDPHQIEDKASGTGGWAITSEGGVTEAQGVAAKAGRGDRWEGKNQSLALGEP